MTIIHPDRATPEQRRRTGSYVGLTEDWSMCAAAVQPVSWGPVPQPDTRPFVCRCPNLAEVGAIFCADHEEVIDA